MPWKKTTGGDILADIAYGYDAASRRTWRQDMTPESEAAFDRFYGYDALGQVKAADRGTLNQNRTAIGGIPEEAEAWNYDEQGNWLAYRKNEDGINEIDQHRRNNESNQITTVDGSNAGVAYDKNGNMLRVPTGDALTGSPRHLKWNAWNQLVEVRDDEEELIQRNVYDALFRRITRELNDSTEIHCYYNDQWRPVEGRIDSSTDASAVYFWGARYRDDLARRDRDTNADGTLDESLWCMMDYFDPIAVIDDEGEVVERYAFSAFGVASILAPDYSARGSSAVAWDFLFHGQFEDAETGWQNYGYRFYVPMLGGWINRDPIEEDGGVNLYGFVSNDGINSSDYLGMAASCDLCGDSRRANKLAYLACLRRNGFDPDPQDYPPADEWDSMLRPGEFRSNRTSWQNNEGNQLNRQNFRGIPDDPFAGGRKPKVGNGTGSGERLGGGTVSINDLITNLTTGIGDALSFGVGKQIRDALGLGGYVDSSSSAYKWGQAVGLVGGLVGGGWSISATRAIASGTRAVKVTSFASKGITPHLNTNTWVAKGGPAIGYVRSGLWAGKGGSFSGPRFVGPGNSITDTVKVKFPSSRFLGWDGNWKSYTWGQFKVR